jgi:hypothetical protein
MSERPLSHDDVGHLIADTPFIAAMRACVTRVAPGMTG